MSTKAEIQKQAQAIIANMPDVAAAVAKRKTEEPEYRSVDKPGDYLFKIEELKHLKSNQEYSGKLKSEQKLLNFDPETGEQLPHYEDAGDELALKLRVVSDDDDKGKTFFTRIRFSSYLKMKDVPEDELDNYTAIRGYACVKNDNGQYVRQISEEGMEKLHAIHNQICHAMGQTGSDIVTAVVTTHIEGLPFGLKVVGDDSYDGKMRLKEGNFFPASALVKDAVQSEIEGDFSA